MLQPREFRCGRPIKRTRTCVPLKTEPLELEILKVKSVVLCVIEPKRPIKSSRSGAPLEVGSVNPLVGPYLVSELRPQSPRGCQTVESFRDKTNPSFFKHDGEPALDILAIEVQQKQH